MTLPIKGITKHILHLLQDGEKSTTSLLRSIQKHRPKTTKQAMYAALRNLHTQEIIVLHRGRAALNTVWLERMNTCITLAQHAYVTDTPGSFMTLSEGDRITYYFKSPEQSDIFWIHALFNYLLFIPKKEPLYLYNPHCWFLLTRKESELGLIKQAEKTGHLYLLTVGGRTPLDRTICRYMNNQTTQYAMVNPVFSSPSYYVNVIGSFIIEVWIEKNIATKIEALYRNVRQEDEKTIQQLQALTASRGRSRLVISHNRKKAEQLKKKFQKLFYYPQ